MFGKAISFGGVLLLTGAVVLATPGLGWAKPHGGGGHGGGHGGGGGGHFGGGGHYGGGHFGGYGGGFYHGGGHYGGYHNGGYRYGHYGYGYGSRYYRPYYGYGYGYGYPYDYGSYGYPYDSGYSGSYSYVTPDSADVTTPAAPSAGGYQSFYLPPAASAPADTRAHVTVKAPADARLWFDGDPTTSTGSVRLFNSPPLTPGRYSYEVRARWTENGREVTQTQQVQVTPGARVEVDFPMASKSADRPPVSQAR